MSQSNAPSYFSRNLEELWVADQVYGRCQKLASENPTGESLRSVAHLGQRCILLRLFALALPNQVLIP